MLVLTVWPGVSQGIGGDEKGSRGNLREGVEGEVGSEGSGGRREDLATKRDLARERASQVSRHEQ